MYKMADFFPMKKALYQKKKNSVKVLQQFPEM